MKKSKLVKIAIGMICGGLVVSLIGFAMGGKTTMTKSDFGYKVVDEGKRIKENKELEEFNKINIDVDLDNIELIKSDKNKIELNYSEGNNKVEYKVEEGTLVIRQPENKQIGIGFNINLDPIKGNFENLNYMKLYVKDSSTLEELIVNVGDADIKINDMNSVNADIKCDYGDLELNNMVASKANIKMQDGDVFTKNIQCDQFIVNNAYGNLNINNITSKIFNTMAKDGNIDIDNTNISDDMKIENNYGNVDIKNCEIGNLTSKLQDGNINLSNSSVKNSNITNQYGNISSNEFLSNGLTIDANDGEIDLRGKFLGVNNINNEYGKVYITSQEEEKIYNYSLISSDGDINVNQTNYENSFIKDNNGKNTLNVDCKNGDIKIQFTK